MGAEASAATVCGVTPQRLRGAIMGLFPGPMEAAATMGMVSASAQVTHMATPLTCPAITVTMGTELLRIRISGTDIIPTLMCPHSHRQSQAA